ncbi:MAG: SHOCT domain-containing protein [Flexistipes sinusarabici]|uniref:SHOCT domain-containing protein n=1 Tax=Flexistipes sinusarabici TaxID=2352 RepID=A0A5D0MMG1_FLESI|nr:SHOCT domain-containing protein [Flexistipes sinusarabici]TYB32640.1 MAG: SHOCT domain-containing protein [Flexistipes sinusarabici]
MMNGMWFGWIFLLVILGLIIWVAVTMINKKQSRGDHRNQHYEEDALDILSKRYARGEITRDEYERLKDDLE